MKTNAGWCSYENRLLLRQHQNKCCEKKREDDQKRQWWAGCRVCTIPDDNSTKLPMTPKPCKRKFVVSSSFRFILYKSFLSFFIKLIKFIDKYNKINILLKYIPSVSYYKLFCFFHSQTFLSLIKLIKNILTFSTQIKHNINIYSMLHLLKLIQYGRYSMVVSFS